MVKRTIVVGVLGLALVAAGVAAAAAIANPQSVRALVAHHAHVSGTHITLHKTKIGKVVATSSGVTLYLFMVDRHGKSSCYGQCATYWPPVLKKGRLSVGKGLKARYLGTTKRKNGRRQVTYRGHPLYRFKLDHGAGKLGGQGQNFFGGKWYAVSASGRADRKSPSQTGTTTSTTTTQYTTTSRY